MYIQPRCDIENGSTGPMDAAVPASRLVRHVTVYEIAILLSFGLFQVIRAFGESLTPPTATRSAAGTAAPKFDLLMHVLLVLLAIVVLSRVMAWIARYLRQPPVIGEVLAGIVLGPSLLGGVAPRLEAYLLPPEIGPSLGLIAQIGLIIYMFTIRLDLDTTALARRGRAAVAISHASIVAPFLLGAVLAVWLYPRFSAGGESFTVFALFLGAAMSVTAFPVLARILTDGAMSRSPIGAMALTCAAVDDVTAWCLLALVVSVARAEIGGALIVILGAACYIAIMFLVVRPLLSCQGRFEREEGVFAATPPAVMAALLISAWTIELIGVHAVFGAFVLGAVIPRGSRSVRQIARRMQDVVSVLLLPAFFAYTGMRTQIGLVSGMQEWLVCGLIILVATLGKFGGSLAAARLAGIGWRNAAALGVLMNTRGLMELIVLNIGLDLGVISPRLFAMMVLMALVTTIATTPIVHLLVGAAQGRPLDGPIGRIPMTTLPAGATSMS